MRSAILLFLICLLVACNGEQLRKDHKRDVPVNANDFNSIANRALELIDPKDAISAIVVPSDLDPRARAALAKMKTLVSVDKVPQSPQYTLPARFFALTTFSISVEDGSATFEGQLGPVARAMTAANMPDCGKIYTVAFYLDGDDWVSHAFKMGTCTESRHWTPIDAEHDHH